MVQPDYETMTPELACAFKALFDVVNAKATGEDPTVEPFAGAVRPVYVAEKGIRIERREVDFTASTPDIDSQGDIVEQDFLFERFLGTSYTVGVLLIVAVVLTYTITGGMFSDAYTAFIQMVITMIGSLRSPRRRTISTSRFSPFWIRARPRSR